MIERFIQQSQTSEKYIIPYTGIANTVLEIGCGEGGNLLPYFNKKCEIMGVDMSYSKIKYARDHYSSPDAKFIHGDIYMRKPEKFDLVIIKESLEHIWHQYIFMKFLQNFLKSETKVFIAFSPWCMPFGGHQQCCKSFLRYIPYLHLLPFYGALLRRFETTKKVEALMEIKETRLSVKKFKQIINDYKIEKETFWLINPSYDAKFGLKPVKFINIPFLTTSYWCIISKKNNQ
jgi:ubiquinone/menaquinone biosynthesis C-methylase UbiE